jgi:type II secretory pathway predicted ATPase ExeA
MQCIDSKTLRHFGVERKGRFASDVTEMYVSEITDAVRDNQAIAVVGSFGQGKTELVRTATRRLSARESLAVVEVMDPNRERQTIATIMNAVIYELSAENPRRDAEARARQFIKLVGQRVVSEGKRVAIVVENAHRLHPMTLMAIKDLRERSFAGVAPLFSILLVAQPPLLQRLEKVREVLLRTNVVELTADAGWMTLPERERYLEAVYGEALPETLRRTVAAAHTSPLALDACVEDAMRRARRMGYDALDERTIEPPIQMLIAQALQHTGLSQNKLADAVGLGRATMTDIKTRGDEHSCAAELREKLRRLNLQPTIPTSLAA